MSNLAELLEQQAAAKAATKALATQIKQAKDNSAFIYTFDAEVKNKDGDVKVVQKTAIGRPSGKRKVNEMYEVTLGENPTITKVV